MCCSCQVFCWKPTLLSCLPQPYFFQWYWNNCNWVQWRLCYLQEDIFSKHWNRVGDIVQRERVHHSINIIRFIYLFIDHFSTWTRLADMVAKRYLHSCGIVDVQVPLIWAFFTTHKSNFSEHMAFLFLSYIGLSSYDGYGWAEQNTRPPWGPVALWGPGLVYKVTMGNFCVYQYTLICLCWRPCQNNNSKVLLGSTPNLAIRRGRIFNGGPDNRVTYVRDHQGGFLYQLNEVRYQILIEKNTKNVFEHKQATMSWETEALLDPEGLDTFLGSSEVIDQRYFPSCGMPWICTLGFN